MKCRNFFELGDVTIGMYVILIIACIIMKLFIDFVPNVKFAKKYNKMCFMTCKSDLCRHFINKSRGGDYFLDSTGKNPDCFFTAWEGSHIILHIIIGYYYNLATSLSLSIGWELYEHYSVMDCANILDILWNMVGYVIGYSLRKLICQ